MNFQTCQIREPIKILSIDDDPPSRMLVRVVLEASGYLVVDAEDGLHGIDAAIREEPALILLDIKLPGAHGCEVLGWLKSVPNLASIPVVAVTAYPMRYSRDRMLSKGCRGYLQKPIDVDALPHQIAEFLEAREEGRP